jgi:hypothetical protein
MEALIPIVLFISLFGAIAYTTKIISDNRVRRELMNKDVDKDIIQKLFLENRAEDINSNLKWGIVAVFLGTALTVIQFTGLSSEEPLTYGITLIAGGIALLVYYLIVQRK